MSHGRFDRASGSEARGDRLEPARNRVSCHYLLHSSGMHFPLARSSLSTVHGSCIFILRYIFQILLRSSWPAITPHFHFFVLFSDISCAPCGPQIQLHFLLSLHVSCIFIPRSLSDLSHAPRALHFHHPHPHQHKPPPPIFHLEGG